METELELMEPGGRTCVCGVWVVGHRGSAGVPGEGQEGGCIWAFGTAHLWLCHLLARDLGQVPSPPGASASSSVEWG